MGGRGGPCLICWGGGTFEVMVPGTMGVGGVGGPKKGVGEEKKDLKAEETGITVHPSHGP